MKKHVIMSLALMLGSLVFAQKKEVSAIEKAIKKGDFASAKSALQTAEGLLSAMDDKTKAKFYFLKGQTLYANGKGSDEETSEAVDAFNESKNIENSAGKKLYTNQINTLKQDIISSFDRKGQEALRQKNFNAASTHFENAYNLSPADTVYLYNAAILSMNGQDYDNAISLFNKLNRIGYVGQNIEYYATEINSGKEELFQSKTLRDASVRTKTHNNPRNEKKPSKASEIAKNIALLYVQQGQKERALEAINEAKKSNPNDYNLIVAEAQVNYQIGNTDEYRRLIEKAVELQPNNVDLIFNLGITSRDNKDYVSAEKYYKKVIEINPKYTNAYIALAEIVLNEEKDIVEEMNSLGVSAEDNKKFEELQVKRTRVYNSAIGYYEKTLELTPKNIDIAKTLVNLYSAIDDQTKLDVMKAKVEELENNN